VPLPSPSPRWLRSGGRACVRAEDTLRFNALRWREVGMIRNTPQKLIDPGTDWRFLNELKRELKA
jgi:hypothetical protein